MHATSIAPLGTTAANLAALGAAIKANEPLATAPRPAAALLGQIQVVTAGCGRVQ